MKALLAQGVGPEEGRPGNCATTPTGVLNAPVFPFGILQRALDPRTQALMKLNTLLLGYLVGSRILVLEP